MYYRIVLLFSVIKTTIQDEKKEKCRINQKSFLLFRITKHLGLTNEKNTHKDLNIKKKHIAELIVPTTKRKLFLYSSKIIMRMKQYGNKERLNH